MSSFAAARRFVWQRVPLIHYFAGLFIRVPTVAAAVGVDILPEIKTGQIQSNSSTFPLCKIYSAMLSDERETVALAVIRQMGRGSWTFEPSENLTSPSSTVTVHQGRELQADTSETPPQLFGKGKCRKINCVWPSLSTYPSEAHKQKDELRLERGRRQYREERDVFVGYDRGLKHMSLQTFPLGPISRV